MSLFWIITSVIFVLVGAYYFFVVGDIARAAWYVALGALSHSFYVSTEK